MKKISVLAAAGLFAATVMTSCGETGGIDNEVLPTAGTISLANAPETDAPTETESESETASETLPETETEIISETETEIISETETETISETETETISETETEIISETETLSETISETEAEGSAVSSSVMTVTAVSAGPDYTNESAVKLIYAGKCAALGEITDVKAFFGNPVSPEISAPSCMGDGNDITYTYSDFTVTVYAPSSGSPTVMSVISTGRSIENPAGINVGASESDAVSALNGYSYEEGGASVSFFAENGVVTEVDYMILI